MKLENRVALVTGSASGIGRATAIALAAEGAKVIVSDVNITGGEETAHLLTEAGHEAIFIPCDVTRAIQVESLVRRVISTFSRLDCAVNNAGVGGDMTPTDLREEATWDMVLGVNLKGVWLSMKYELAPMLEQSYGSIVNVSSAAGLVGFRYASAYSASKHGVIGATKAAAMEYAKKGIRVNAVCPAVITTALSEGIFTNKDLEASLLAVHPMGRFGTVEEVADAVVFLCSSKSSYITGHSLYVDAGLLAR